MPAIIVAILSWLASGLVQRLLVGAGLMLVTGTGFQFAINAYMDDAMDDLSGAAGTALQFAQMLGVGDALAIVGTAIVGSIWFRQASNLIMGVKKQ